MKEVKIPNSEGKNIAAVIHYPETKTERLAILSSDIKTVNEKIVEALSD